MDIKIIQNINYISIMSGIVDTNETKHSLFSANMKMGIKVFQIHNINYYIKIYVKEN